MGSLVGCLWKQFWWCWCVLLQGLGIDVADDGGVLWVDSITVKDCEKSLQVDFVERLFPVQEEHVEMFVLCFCLFHKASNDVDGL